MDAIINETNLTVRATDSEAILSPALMRRIVNEVVAELDQREMYAERQRRIRRIDQGALLRNENVS